MESIQIQRLLVGHENVLWAIFPVIEKGKRGGAGLIIANRLLEAEMAYV